MAAMRIGKDDLNMVCHKAGMGQRLDRKEAEVLYFDADLHTLAHLAHNMRHRACYHRKFMLFFRANVQNRHSGGKLSMRGNHAA